MDMRFLILVYPCICKHSAREDHHLRADEQRIEIFWAHGLHCMIQIRIQETTHHVAGLPVFET